MKWIYFFGNLDGRIGRKTFWLASLGVLVTGFVVAAVAAAIAEKLADEVARDMAVEGVVLLFLLPYFMLAVKRGHDRNISTWIISGWFVLVATTDALDFFWLAAERSRPLKVRSFCACRHLGHGDRWSRAAHRALFSPRHQG
jgi:uncharacterized membrane protein YhaH (DUF805 family)